MKSMLAVTQFPALSSFGRNFVVTALITGWPCRHIIIVSCCLLLSVHVQCKLVLIISFHGKINSRQTSIYNS